jgi:hypothetical protein
MNIPSEIISDLNSEMEYTEDQLGFDEQFDAITVTNCRYQMKNGKRLDRMIMLHRPSGKLFELTPRELPYHQLTAEEKADLDERVSNWNEAVPMEYALTIESKPEL